MSRKRFWLRSVNDVLVCLEVSRLATGLLVYSFTTFTKNISLLRKSGLHLTSLAVRQQIGRNSKTALQNSEWLKEGSSSHLWFSHRLFCGHADSSAECLLLLLNNHDGGASIFNKKSQNNTMKIEIIASQRFRLFLLFFVWAV